MIFRFHRPGRDSTPCFSLEQASMSKSQHGLVGAELNARARGTVPEYGSAFAGVTMVVLSESGFTGWEDFQDGVGGQPSFDRLPPQRICDRTNGCGRDARAPRMAPTNWGQVLIRGQHRQSPATPLDSGLRRSDGLTGVFSNGVAGSCIIRRAD